MKRVREMPKEGQFICIHENGGHMWSSTLRWVNGELLEYDGCEDCFYESFESRSSPDIEYKYYVYFE